MNVVNKVTPNEEQMKGFMEPGYDAPIYMLNLQNTRMVVRRALPGQKPMASMLQKSFPILPRLGVLRCLPLR